MGDRGRHWYGGRNGNGVRLPTLLDGRVLEREEERKAKVRKTAEPEAKAKSKA